MIATIPLFFRLHCSEHMKVHDYEYYYYLPQMKELSDLNVQYVIYAELLLRSKRNMIHNISTTYLLLLLMEVDHK